jgi:hypothetical protein
MTDAQHDSAATVGGSADMVLAEDERSENVRHNAADASADAAAPSSSSSSSAPLAAPPVLKLRNYRPRDKSIRYTALARPSYMKGQGEHGRSLTLLSCCAVAADSEWLDGELSSLVSSALAADSADVLLSIAPQSINSDLKRDIAPKLAILKRQTKQALQEMLSQTDSSHALIYATRCCLSC